MGRRRLIKLGAEREKSSPPQLSCGVKSKVEERRGVSMMFHPEQHSISPADGGKRGAGPMATFSIGLGLLRRGTGYMLAYLLLVRIVETLLGWETEEGWVARYSLSVGPGRGSIVVERGIESSAR